jgi:hypothetical protein
LPVRNSSTRIGFSYPNFSRISEMALTSPSTVFATLLRDTPRERVRFGLMAFAAFVLSTLVIGWLTNPFPR